VVPGRTQIDEKSSPTDVVPSRIESNGISIFAIKSDEKPVPIPIPSGEPTSQSQETKELESLPAQSANFPVHENSVFFPVDENSVLNLTAPAPIPIPSGEPILQSQETKELESLPSQNDDFPVHENSASNDSNWDGSTQSSYKTWDESTLQSTVGGAYSVDGDMSLASNASVDLLYMFETILFNTTNRLIGNVIDLCCNPTTSNNNSTKKRARSTDEKTLSYDEESYKDLGNEEHERDTKDTIENNYSARDRARDIVARNKVEKNRGNIGEVKRKVLSIEFGLTEYV
jgi:hypothetical protein